MDKDKKKQHPPHPFVPFRRDIPQNVDSLRSEIHRRDSVQAAQDKAIDDSAIAAEAKSAKADKLKKFMQKGK